MRPFVNSLLCFALLLSAAPHAKARADKRAAAAGVFDARAKAVSRVPLRQDAHVGARKIDEFGDIQLSDLKARLDFFAVELQNMPVARGFIVAYAVPNKLPGWPLRRAKVSLDYMVNTRGIDPSRVSVFNGGFRDSIKFQLWIVETGAELPLPPFDWAAALSREKTPFLFDRFPVIERGDPDESDYEDSYAYRPDVAGLYEPFAEVLRNDPGLRGCVIAYSLLRNRRGADRKLAARVKTALTKAHAVDLGRVVAIGGGRRAQKSVELWFVPPGASLPKPAPAERPARRKRR